MQLNDLLGHYDELLYLPDKTPILAALAIVAAQDIPGPPVWTLLVGPPSSGKTEIIHSLRLVNGAVSVSTLTKASLLSGRTGGAGGLLLTHFPNCHGLLLVKDFTSILSEAAGARTETIAVLREVYDGHITRAVGSRDTPLTWTGQISFLGAVTEEIELHRATIDLMGNRFLYVPMPPTHRAREEIARTAIMQTRQQHQTREALAVAVSDFFTQLPPPPSLDLGDDEIDRLVSGATFAALARSPIIRDTRSREIDLTPEPESPARLAGEAHQLRQGLSAIGASPPQARKVIRAALLGSVPKQRRIVLGALLDAEGPLRTAQVAVRTRTPESSIRRALEDLAALGVIEFNHAAYNGWGNQFWTPTAVTRQLWAVMEA